MISLSNFQYILENESTTAYLLHTIPLAYFMREFPISRRDFLLGMGVAAGAAMLPNIVVAAMGQPSTSALPMKGGVTAASPSPLAWGEGKAVIAAGLYHAAVDATPKGGSGFAHTIIHAWPCGHRPAKLAMSSNSCSIVAKPMQGLHAKERLAEFPYQKGKWPPQPAHICPDSSLPP